eukprot:363727-Chlamydomonas_euryale.AAC.3
MQASGGVLLARSGQRSELMQASSGVQLARSGQRSELGTLRSLRGRSKHVLRTFTLTWLSPPAHILSFKCLGSLSNTHFERWGSAPPTPIPRQK